MIDLRLNKSEAVVLRDLLTNSVSNNTTLAGIYSQLNTKIRQEAKRAEYTDLQVRKNQHRS